MTTGRINQVCTIGFARAPAGPRPPGCGPQHALARPPGPASRRAPLTLRRRARGLSPVQAALDSRARLPTPRRSAPRAGPGAELPMRGGPHGRSLARPRPAPPSASARSRWLQTPGRVSPRLGGACLRPGWGPSCPCGVAPSGARSPAPSLRRPRLAGPRPRLLLVHTFGAPAPPRVKPWRPLGTVRLRTATRTKACDPSATASALPLGRPPPRKDTSRLRGGHRSPHAPGPSRRDGAPAPGYGAPRPAAGQGLAPSACGAGALAAARGPATVRFAC